MSDNEDLLGDDLGDQSLADYNLGNEEEEQLLADDYDHNAPQNVPTSVATGYNESVDMGPVEYSSHSMEYTAQAVPYPVTDSECVVPNISVEVPNVRLPEHSTYAPYPEPPVYETEHAVVPPAIPAAPVESPQIVPSEVNAPLLNGDLGPRERFTSERPTGAQRMPQVRDIPDSLDKVYVPRGGIAGRGRNTWRNPQYRSSHPYRRNNTQRNNFSSRSSFPPPQIRQNPEPPPQIRLTIPEMRPDIPPQPMRPELSPERTILLQELPNYRPIENRFPQNFQRFPPFRSNEEPRSFTPNNRSNFEPKPLFQYQPSYPRYPPIHDIVPSNISHIPQVTIRQHMPVGGGLPKMDKFPPKMNLEQEVRMLPLQLPPNIPPGGLAGKKVLINPHFKGNFQPLVEGLPTYIPTRIQKTPPLSPTLESKFGPIKDIDDAAERFIAEQRNALARAANRKIVRRSPQRYIENTVIEIKNDLARCSEDEELLRRQEEFINANRAGLRRRMRSPSPVRRSPSPRRSPPRRTRTDAHDEETEYRRRVREQESMRERVLRAKEVRRRKNAAALQKQVQDKDREKEEKDTAKEQQAPKVENPTKPENLKPVETNADNNPTSTQPDKPDTTRKSPENVEITEKVEKVEKLRERSPVKLVKDDTEINSTCENLTPPREKMPQVERVPTPDRALTPPLPEAVRSRGLDSDDELDLILDDIDGILSDEDDTGRFKEKKEPEKPKQKSQVDLRSKLPPKLTESKAPRQKIVFNEKDDRKKKEKSPVRRTLVTSSTKAVNDSGEKKTAKGRQRGDAGAAKSRPRIVYDKKEPEKPKEEEKAKSQTFGQRRVVLQRKPGAPPPVGIFSRAVRTALLAGRADEPRVEYASDEDEAEPAAGSVLGAAATRARVDNLPHGITDTRLRTLAGDELQSLMLNKEERTAKITFKTSVAAENFRRKFNNKMIAASRLTVTLL